MSLEQCHECGHEVADSANKCQNCGASRWTKWQITGVVVFSFLITLLFAGPFIYLLLKFKAFLESGSP